MKNDSKILLLVNNWSAQVDIQGLKQIKTVFLSVNMTSVLQPMGQKVPERPLQKENGAPTHWREREREQKI